MIIEQIGAWFMSMGTWAISMLPENGNTFKTVPSLDVTIFKYISLINGYFPIIELGKVLVLMIAISLSMQAIRLGQFAFNYLVKLLP